MAKQKSSSGHIILDSDVAEYLQLTASRTGLSVTYLANQYIRLIKTAQHNVSLELKPNAQISAKRDNVESMKFTKAAETRIQIDYDEL